nr:uncharacterized protein LOC110568017 [Aotus nancymaae]
MQGKDQPAPASPDAGNAPPQLQAKQRGSSTMNQITKSSEAVTVKTPSGKKKNNKGIKKKIEGLMEAGPWLVKLHLADNGIGGKGKEGENGLLEFIQTLTRLIKYSAHLREIDLGNNVLGEMAAADILEALSVRKTAQPAERSPDINCKTQVTAPHRLCPSDSRVKAKTRINRWGHSGALVTRAPFNSGKVDVVTINDLFIDHNYMACMFHYEHVPV